MRIIADVETRSALEIVAVVASAEGVEHARVISRSGCKRLV